MRHDRLQHQRDGLPQLLHQRPALHRHIVETASLVDQLHDRGDGGVEGLASPEVVTDLGNGLVQLAPQRLLPRIQARDVQRLDRTAADVRMHAAPQAPQES